MSSTTKRGVILMNLGSPDSPTAGDVKKYLDEFLMDERVLDYPYLLRLLLVKGLITPKRSPRSADAYKKVWTEDGSPLVSLTRQLDAAFSKVVDYPVAIAMRYGSPTPKDAFDKLYAAHPDMEEVIAIPLYPHYAMSSYETAVVSAQEIHQKGKYPFKLQFIKPYYNNEQYIHAMAENIRPYLNQEYDQILFSYHGLPERHMRKADPTGMHCMKSENCCETPSAAHATCYRHQCFTTTRLITEQLNIPKEKYRNSFQSRLGREEWLKPYTALRLEELPKEGVKKLIILCPAFVSDCLETLEEIAMEGRDSFMKAGGESFTLVPCLNLHPLWIEAMASWFRQIEAGNKEMLMAGL